MVTLQKTPESFFFRQSVEKQGFIVESEQEIFDKITDNQRDRRIPVLLVCAFVLFCMAAIMKVLPPGSSAGKFDSAAAQLVWSGGFLSTERSSIPPASPGLDELPPAMTPFFFMPIPVNLADARLLETINGIGPHLAAKIVDERQARGIFRGRDDLLRVSGLGPKRIKQIENQLSFAGEE